MPQLKIDDEIFNTLLASSLNRLLTCIDTMGLNFNKYLDYIEDEEVSLINNEIDKILHNYLIKQNKEWHESRNDMNNSLFNVKLYDLNFTYDLFNNFIESLESLSQKYPNAIEAFQQMYVNPEKISFRGLYPSIKKHQIHFDKKISQAPLKDDMNDLLSRADAIYNDFMSKYYIHRCAMLTDEILSYNKSNLSQKFKISSVPIEQLQDKKTMYIDQNIISYYENKNSKSHDKIRQLKDNYHLICSVYVIEDSVKRHAIFFKDYLSTLNELCNNLFIGKIGDSLEIITEDIQTILNRISLWLITTRNAELLYTFSRKRDFHTYPYFPLRELFDKKFGAKELISFFQNIQTDQEIYQILEVKTLFYPDINLLDLINNKINISEKNDKEICKIIEDLCSMLDVINFQTCKITNDKLLKSSYQDIQHLQHAWKADYFITADKNLFQRATYIYQLLQLPVKAQLFEP